MSAFSNDRIPLACMRYYRHAIRDVYGFLSGLNREYIKHSGLNSWDGVMDILQEIMKNPEPLMDNPWDCEYPIPEKYQKKYRKWADKQKAKRQEEYDSLMKRRINICKEFAEAPTWCNSDCPFYELRFASPVEECENICRHNIIKVRKILENYDKGVK